MNLHHFFLHYKYALIIPVILALIAGSYVALDWRDKTVCFGGCNWNQLETNKISIMLEYFLSTFLVSLAVLLALSLIINCCCRIL